MGSPILGPVPHEHARDSSAIPQRLWGFEARVRAYLLTLTFLAAGASVLMLVLLYTIGILADSYCGEIFSYYGCDTQISKPLKSP